MALASQTVTAAPGSVAATELTAEQVQRVLVQPLEQESVFLSSGVKIIDTAGPLRLPLGPSSVADEIAFVGENELIGEVEPTFDDLELMPSTMKSLKTITRWSSEVARQSIVALDSVLKTRLVSDVAAKVDAHFLSAGGDGVSTPRGLFGFTGTQQVAVGGPLDLDAVLEGLSLLVKAHVPASGLKLFVRPDDFLGIRAARDTTGRFIMAPESADGLNTKLLGVTPVLTDRIPAGQAALVSPGHIVVARDASPSIKVLDQTFGQYDQVALRVTSRYDAAPTAPEAVVIFNGITAEPAA